MGQNFSFDILIILKVSYDFISFLSLEIFKPELIRIIKLGLVGTSGNRCNWNLRVGKKKF